MWLDLRSLWEAPGALSLSIEPGSISISGQSTTFATNLAQSTQGSVTFQGQSAAFTFNEAISTNGSITVGGQSITFTIGLAEGTQGSITFQGQAVTPSVGLAISTQGSITFDGQSIALNLGGNLTLDIDLAGSIFLTGQALTLFVSDQAITTPPSGGWPFYIAYEQELARRQRARRKRLEDEEEALRVEDAISREIARLLHEQERKDAERADLARLKALVAQYRESDLKDLAPRVISAYTRALVQENFSALQALDRELQRQMQEEEMAVMLLLLADD